MPTAGDIPTSLLFITDIYFFFIIIFFKFYRTVNKIKVDNYISQHIYQLVRSVGIMYYAGPKKKIKLFNPINLNLSILLLDRVVTLR